jgi:RNA polymerase sigma factor (sigma-70 family)
MPTLRFNVVFSENRESEKVEKSVTGMNVHSPYIRRVTSSAKSRGNRQKKEERRSLLEKIWELPDKDRILILLYYYQELSIKEISGMLNIREGAVKTKLFRARNKLQAKYKSTLHPLNKVGDLS